MAESRNEISFDRPVARFATEGGKITKELVKPKLFQPNKALQVSIFRIAGLTRDKIQELGMSIVSKIPSSSRLYGWATLERKAITNIGLIVDDDDNPPGHSNIVGWPSEVNKQLRYQLELAACSTSTKLDAPIEVD